MEMHEIYFKLPDLQAMALRRLAAQQDVSVGQIVRTAIANEIRRQTRDVGGPSRAEEELLAPLRALLAGDLAAARSWEDLQARLRHKGYEFREAGGGLSLHRHPSGDRVCKASELGFAYRTLMRQFNAPFPGHRHAHLERSVLGREPLEEPIDLIEPF